MLKQRKPMPRGKGFQRSKRRAGAAAEVHNGAQNIPEIIPAAPRPAQRRGTYAADPFRPTAARPKTVPHRNRHLLDMARGQRCLLRVVGVCSGGTETTVACHSNLSIHGKAGRRKADDEYSAAGCHACHTWLDNGPADAEIKALAFMAAHLLQVDHWRAIAADSTQPPKDRAAARWALDHLNASPIGQGDCHAL